MASWRKDFNWSWRGVVYKETGAKIPFTPHLFYEIYLWAFFTFSEKFRSLFKRRRAVMVCYPKTIRPWYMVWAVLTRLGIKLVNPEKLNEADFAYYFCDETTTNPPAAPSVKRTFNFGCDDISKSKVTQIFESVFGYDLSVDPTKENGLMVVKSEENGAHDGQIIKGPAQREANKVYQKVVNNQTDDGHVQDLRCPMLFGKPALVFIKERKLEDRFQNSNARCRLADPADFFSPAELENISRFCHEMKLDFGGIDILRDRDTNRLYIVDVNKTDMGPPMALKMKDKFKSISILAKAFETELFGPTEDK